MKIIQLFKSIQKSIECKFLGIYTSIEHQTIKIVIRALKHQLSSKVTLPINMSTSKTNMQNETLNNIQHQSFESIQCGDLQLDNCPLDRSSDIEQSDKQSNERAVKARSRKKRDVIALDDSKIISARLRSDSGKVYSTGLTLDSAATSTASLDSVAEESANDKSSEMCLTGDCCKNTSKIIDMITKLQESMDDVLKKSGNQEIISSNNTHKIEDLQDACEKNASEIDEVIEELKETKFQLEMVTNVVIRQDQQIDLLRQKIVDMQQREMSANLVISGITERKGEKPLQLFNEFVTKQLEMQELVPANRAFRIGSGVNRPLVVELRHPENKKRIYANATKLKGKTNEKGNSFFVSDHLPEELNENKRRINELIADNKRKPTSHRLDMQMERGKLMINEEPYQKAIKPLCARDILDPNEKVIDKARTIEIVKGKEESQKNSRFAAFAAAVDDLEDVKAALTKMKMKYSDATHVSCAYRLPGSNSPKHQDYLDDGEFGCGRTMLKSIREHKLFNVAVFMVRYYGGSHLGIRRYDIFRELASSAVKELIKSRKQDESEGPAVAPLPDRFEQNDETPLNNWDQNEDWSTIKKTE